MKRFRVAGVYCRYRRYAEPRTMKLQQLKYLLAIVDNGLNITAAAERLYTSQPGVSKQLKLLEEELGTPLFLRRGKCLAETMAIGDKIIARARRVMREVEQIRALARGNERHRNDDNRAAAGSSLFSVE